MQYRQAETRDLDQINFVRHAVKENRLSGDFVISKAEVEDYITNRGRGWVCEIENTIVGFAIVDLVDNNVWALFVHPDFEARGIGKNLHNIMMNWYFKQTDKTIWLSTDGSTRAWKFYQLQGWRETGLYGKGEIKFEMDINTWNNASIDKLE